MEIGFEKLGEPEVLADKMEHEAERAATISSTFPAAAVAIRAVESRRFASNGNGQWQPLAAATIADKERQGYDSTRILYRTGRLEASVASQSGDSVIEMTPNTLFVGTSVPYAHWHQTGGDRNHASGAGWPPQRPIYKFSGADRLSVLRVIKDWVFGGSE